MTARRRPRLTQARWAAVLAKYAELGRPLTDAELRTYLEAPGE